MGTVSLNLSRKWRSQNFDQLIGQDLAVRILKNSLYLGHYFPVYLFAGQRGCGKTSTARIFAAALNCDMLATFQKDPKKLSIPCLVCPSCNAMLEGNHPDFIEIDAASHTGVDNMRNIIESSSLLPIMGKKRVYLIDEAHMLSKAAFNAALKILEEPPATAIFILATTNPQKIIDTVRSRCFQLFFAPVADIPLKNHLQTICKNENINYDNDALDIIIRQTEGSVRDALNMLEQVRFSNAVVNKTAVLKLLGHMSDQQLFDVIRETINGSAQSLLQLLHTLNIDHYSGEFIWQRLMVLLRSLLWAKHGVNSDQLAAVMFVEKNALDFSLENIQNMIEVLYSYEELFLKTTSQHLLLEMILLNLCRKDKKKTDGDGGPAPCSVTSIHSASSLPVIDNHEVSNDFSGDSFAQWALFINQIVPINHPIISSLFKQSRLVEYNQEKNQLVVEFSRELVLFKEWIDTSRDVWQPLLKKIFSNDIQLEVRFTGESKSDKNGKQVNGRAAQEVSQRPTQEGRSPKTQYKETTTSGTSHEQFFGSSQQQYRKKVLPSVQKNEERVDVSNESEWRMASMLLRHFPGVITEMREGL